MYRSLFKHILAVNVFSLSCLFCLILLTSCEEEVEQQDTIVELTNTLNDPTIGNGKTGIVTDYFYNFGDDIHGEFYRFGQANNRVDYSYGEYLSLFNMEPPILSLNTFPEYQIKITPDSIEMSHRTLIDSIFLDKTSTTMINSTPFWNLQNLEWDSTKQVEIQRYTANFYSDALLDSFEVTYHDTLDSIVYKAVIDTPMIDYGAVFVDTSEWIDTTYIYLSNEKLQFDHTFSFPRIQLNGDSLMYRINTDCNDNGTWDDSTTASSGNGIWDPPEAFYDFDNDSEYDLNEPYEDRNCNGDWDGAESFDDSNGNGWYDEGEPFTDRENLHLTSTELFTDLNGDSAPDSNELFRYSDAPRTLLISWVDHQNPRIINPINLGDSLITRHGMIYRNIIEEVESIENKVNEVDDIDSLVTLRTNQIVAHISNADEEYFIGKTEWERDNPPDDEEPRTYDYHLFRTEEHVLQALQPSYFKPYGYYWSESDLESGFWHQNEFVEEILYFTSNGLLRDGEVVQEFYYDTTEVAIYKMEKTFEVISDTITVPAKQQRGIIDNTTGEVVCYFDSTWSANTIEDCPGADTTFTDCFRIKKQLTMTMIGSDVEYREKHYTWLVKDYGIVRDELDVGWQFIFDVGDYWEPVSRWELGSFNKSSDNGSGQLAKMISPAATSIYKLDQLSEFGFDPYIFHRTSGLQRVILPGNE